MNSYSNALFICQFSAIIIDYYFFTSINRDNKIIMIKTLGEKKNFNFKFKNQSKLIMNNFKTTDSTIRLC